MNVFSTSVADAEGEGDEAACGVLQPASEPNSSVKAMQHETNLNAFPFMTFSS
jgi:hypothetical protein